MARMLIIEDDPQARGLMAGPTSMHGHSIMTGETGERGFEMTRLDPPAPLDEVASCLGAGT